MKKPAKFNTYLNAMHKEASRWSFYEVMENCGINEQELDECEEFEIYIRRLEEIPEQKTCHFNKVSDIFYKCDACGWVWMHPELDFVPGIDFRYCPGCSAKVIKDEKTSEV